MISAALVVNAAGPAPSLRYAVSMRCCAVVFAGAFSILAAGVPMDILEAARKGNATEIAALLKKGADLEARDKQGRTPLMLAAQYGRTASVRLLLDKGAKPDARDSHHWNAYMLALLAPSEIGRA